MLTGDGYGAIYAPTEYDWQLHCHNIGRCWDDCSVCEITDLNKVELDELTKDRANERAV